MWIGGVRVMIPDEEGRILMVMQEHEDKEIWMFPGGAIEAGESSADAAIREVFEETGLLISVEDLIWHVEEVSEERGQRFVNFFLGKTIGGKLELGMDPELGEDDQVLSQLEFMTKEEILDLKNVYPSFFKDNIEDILAGKVGEVFRMRED